MRLHDAQDSARLSKLARRAGFAPTSSPVTRRKQDQPAGEPTRSLLTQIRKSRGLSLDEVADKVGTDPTNLSRVEKGAQVPKRELARALWRFYGGTVPLSAIYDPEFCHGNGAT